MMYTIRVSDGVDKVIAKWKKSNPESVLPSKAVRILMLISTVYDVHN